MSSIANVTAAAPKAGGALYRAPAGTALPTDATTALPNTFKCLGYITEDGMKNNMSKTVNEEKAWGGDTVNILETGYSDTFGTKLMEVLDVEVLKTVFGDDNVTGTLTGTGGIHVKANAKEKEDAVYVADMILRGGVLKRIVIGVGRITSVAEIVYSSTASTGYDITITAQADDTGDSHHEYIAQP